MRSYLLFSLALCACGGGAVATDGGPQNDAGPRADSGSPPEDSGTTAPQDSGIVITGKRLFITSGRFTGDLVTEGGETDGIAAADAICAEAASALGGTWRAWISTTSVNAIDRITGTGPWSTVEGTQIFANRNAITTGPETAIWYDEDGEFLATANIWTGTQGDGTYNSRFGACDDWRSPSGEELGAIGQVGRGDGVAWTAYSSTTCSQPSHLICFEQ